MSATKKIIFLFVLLFSVKGKAQNIDTAFFEGLKRFYVKKTSHQINPELYTKWAKQTSSPFHYVYASSSKKVKNALPEDDYLYCGHDSDKAENYCKTMKTGGLSVFHYKTFGTSDALVTLHLMNYKTESRAFVVFHELTHNYIKEKKLKLNYLLNEATCDVTGVEFCRLMSAGGNMLDKKNLDAQVKNMEQIYKAINETVLLIDKDSTKCDKYCSTAEKKIKKALKRSDNFYHDRFNYPVNTAYLLKNQNYCKYYFQLAQLYRQSGDYSDFIEKVKELNTKL